MPRIARYIECNPINAGLEERGEDYLWSSARTHLRGIPHERLKLSDWLDPSEREASALFVLATDAEQNTTIRKATRTGRPFGTENFVDTLAGQLNRSVRVKKSGRPKKTS